MNIKVLLAGDGGQGIQTIAYLLTEAAFANNFAVSDIPNFGLEQRGGVSLSFLQFSDEKIVYPKFKKPDILLLMSQQAQSRVKIDEDVEVLNISHYKEILEENNIQIQSYNVYFLGLLGKILARKNILDLDILKNKLKDKLNNKVNWDEIHKAFELGIK